MLNYFHTGEVRSDFRCRMAALDDATSLLMHAVVPHARPSPGTLHALRQAVDDILDSLGHAQAQADLVPPVPDLAPLVDAGVPLLPLGDIVESFGRLAERRQRLLSSVSEVGWDWSAVDAGPGR